MAENKKILSEDERKILEAAKKISAEKKSRKAENNFRLVPMLKIFLFGTILLTLSLIGLITAIRPDVSVAEKRELAKFPEFSISALWDGSFFKATDIWYSDTYPLREVMITANQKFQSLFGKRSEQIIERDKTNVVSAQPVPKKEKSSEKKETPSEKKEPEEKPKDTGSYGQYGIGGQPFPRHANG